MIGLAGFLSSPPAFGNRSTDALPGLIGLAAPVMPIADDSSTFDRLHFLATERGDLSEFESLLLVYSWLCFRLPIFNESPETRGEPCRVIISFGESIPREESLHRE